MIETWHITKKHLNVNNKKKDTRNDHFFLNFTLHLNLMEFFYKNIYIFLIKSLNLKDFSKLL